MGRGVVIVKLTRGKSAGRALAYDYGPGKANEHADPRRVAGTMPGRDWKARAAQLDRHIRAADKTEGRQPRVLRFAVAATDVDRIMSDREWGEIARQVVEQYSGREHDCVAWEAVRHDPRHIHITVSQIADDGKLISNQKSFARCHSIARELEQTYELASALDPSRRRHDGQDTARDKHTATPAKTLRVKLRQVIDRCSSPADLDRAGVRTSIRTRADGTPYGITYSLDGHQWVSGSALGDRYKWSAVRDGFEQAAEERRARETARLRGETVAYDREAPARRTPTPPTTVSPPRPAEIDSAELAELRAARLGGSLDELRQALRSATTREQARAASAAIAARERIEREREQQRRDSRER